LNKFGNYLSEVFKENFKLIKYFSKFHLWVLRISKYTFLNSLIGIPVLVLITTERSSGKERYAPLTYFPDEDSFMIVASNGGNKTPPNWYRNLIKQDSVKVIINNKNYKCKYNVLESEEREIAWISINKIYSKYSEYEEISGRVIPVIKLTPIN
jgi:deazaflavin-dependent oxidoreductase (nitroreductase family)